MASAWRKLLSGGYTLRALVRELRGIRTQLERQGDLLEAVLKAYGVATPAQLAAQQPADLADTGVTYSDQVEAGLIEEYQAKTLRDTGRAPTEEEIMDYLADEKTVVLASRLAERARLIDLERLEKGR